MTNVGKKPDRKPPNPIDKHVGSRVRMRRLMLNMSQEKLADSFGNACLPGSLIRVPAAILAARWKGRIHVPRQGGHEGILCPPCAPEGHSACIPVALMIAP